VKAIQKYRHSPIRPAASNGLITTASRSTPAGALARRAALALDVHKGQRLPWVDHHRVRPRRARASELAPVDALDRDRDFVPLGERLEGLCVAKFFVHLGCFAINLRLSPAFPSADLSNDDTVSPSADEDGERLAPLHLNAPSVDDPGSEADGAVGALGAVDVEAFRADASREASAGRAGRGLLAPRSGQLASPGLGGCRLTRLPPASRPRPPGATVLQLLCENRYLSHWSVVIRELVTTP
jgi:hypothetical protein